MHIFWISLLGGLFFGLIPSRLLLSQKCNYLDLSRIRNKLTTLNEPERHGRRWWKLPLVWIDPVRGYVTATLLAQAVHAAPAGHDASGSERLIAMIITFGLLLLVLWVQAERRSKSNGQLQMVSPTGFLGGMIVGLLPPVVAIAALTLGVATALALTNFSAGYFAASLATLTMGLVFTRNIPLVALQGFLVAFPMLMNWVRRTTLVMPIRS